jgi:hypothetical protein
MSNTDINLEQKLTLPLSNAELEDNNEDGIGRIVGEDIKSNSTVGSADVADSKPTENQKTANTDTDFVLPRIEVNSSSVSLITKSFSSLPYGWYEYKDEFSGCSYYHYSFLNITQWEIPTEQQTRILEAQAVKSQQTFLYDHDRETQKAYFNRNTGKFSHAGSQTYWERLGRENDRAGRQLGAFMDLSTLEKNREDYKKKKDMDALANRGVDWSKHKKEKKELKKRKAQSWVYED